MINPTLIEDGILKELRNNISSGVNIDSLADRLEKSTGNIIATPPFILLLFAPIEIFETDQDRKAGNYKLNFRLLVGSNSLRSFKESKSDCYTLIKKVINILNGFIVEITEDGNKKTIQLSLAGIGEPFKIPELLTTIIYEMNFNYYDSNN